MYPNSSGSNGFEILRIEHRRLPFLDHRYPSMSEYITSKRWSLRDGRQESELVELVREETASHYEKLPGFVRLGLLHIAGTRSYLALQHRKNRDTWRATVESDDYESWLQGYGPMLERWDKLMIFEEDWECEDLLDKGNGA